MKRLYGKGGADIHPAAMRTFRAGEKGKSRKIHNFFVDILENMRIIGFCMDTKKDCMIPKFGHAPDLTGLKFVVGSKQLRKALQKGNVRFVYLAENADPAITEPIEAMCKENSIEYAWVKSMTELGRACGIEVGAAVATVVA